MEYTVSAMQKGKRFQEHFLKEKNLFGLYAS